MYRFQLIIKLYSPSFLFKGPADLIIHLLKCNITNYIPHYMPALYYMYSQSPLQSATSSCMFIYFFLWQQELDIQPPQTAAPQIESVAVLFFLLCLCHFAAKLQSSPLPDVPLPHHFDSGATAFKLHAHKN